MEAARSHAEVMARASTQPELFGLVFDRHFTTIHRYLERRVGHDAADVLSGEVFRIAFEQRSRGARRKRRTSRRPLTIPLVALTRGLEAALVVNLDDGRWEDLTTSLRGRTRRPNSFGRPMADARGQELR